MAQSDAEIVHLLQPWLKPKRWISGRYVLEETQAAFIVVSVDSELVDITYFDYSCWPHIPESYFMPYKRYIWPAGSEEAFRFESEGSGHLSPHSPVSLEELEEEMWDIDWSDPDPRELAGLICPLLDPLTVFDDEEHGDIVDLPTDGEWLELWNLLEDREAPQFWD